MGEIRKLVVLAIAGYHGRFCLIICNNTFRVSTGLYKVSNMKSGLVPFACVALSRYFSLLLALLFRVRSLSPFVVFLQEGNRDNFNDSIFFNLKIM